MVHTSIWQKFFRVLLGLSLIFAGISHVSFARAEFMAQVPDWVPLNKDLLILLSGGAEILLGLALIFIKSKRTLVGWLAALFFILVFPGNIAQYVNKVSAFGLDTDSKRLVRLFFQPILVIWALWSTGAWKASKKVNK
jgi:uncharacterized membrane protein